MLYTYYPMGETEIGRIAIPSQTPSHEKKLGMVIHICHPS
jgi:hypothetical protein